MENPIINNNWHVIGNNQYGYYGDVSKIEELPPDKTGYIIYTLLQKGRIFAPKLITQLYKAQ